jgi:hypothetical protein
MTAHSAVQPWGGGRGGLRAQPAAAALCVAPRPHRVRAAGEGLARSSLQLLQGACDEGCWLHLQGVALAAMQEEVAAREADTLGLAADRDAYCACFHLVMGQLQVGEWRRTGTQTPIMLHGRQRSSGLRPALRSARPPAARCRPRSWSPGGRYTTWAAPGTCYHHLAPQEVVATSAAQQVLLLERAANLGHAAHGMVRGRPAGRTSGHQPATTWPAAPLLQLRVHPVCIGGSAALPKPPGCNHAAAINIETDSRGPRRCRWAPCSARRRLHSSSSSCSWPPAGRTARRGWRPGRTPPPAPPAVPAAPGPTRRTCSTSTTAAAC